MVNLIVSKLSQFNPQVYTAPTGSVYISFSGSKVREIRISDHSGQKLKRNVWQLRTDAMTSRKNPSNRVYNVKDVDNMIKDFK